MKRRFLFLAILALVSCNDMDSQPRDKDYGATDLFGDGKVMQAPPDGTISREDPSERAALADRPAMSMVLLERGRQRYDIYCAPCHDFAGDGHGTVVARGFPAPPSLHLDRLRSAPSSHFVDVISRGYGVMYDYADRVAPTDRWAIAAYIRALQLSQDAEAASLPSKVRQKLEAAHDN
jgi:hypothetical protein